MKQKLSRTNIAEIALVVIAMVSWAVNKGTGGAYPVLGVVTAFSLGVAMGFIGRSFIAQKGASRKIAGVLVLAFGLFNVFIGVVGLYAMFNG